MGWGKRCRSARDVTACSSGGWFSSTSCAFGVPLSGGAMKNSKQYCQIAAILATDLRQGSPFVFFQPSDTELPVYPSRVSDPL